MKFISILGFDRSGTTFLGNYASQFGKKIFYAGEIDKGLEKYFSGAIEKCSCGETYLECPIWGQILPDLQDENDLNRLSEKIKELTGAEVLIDSSKTKEYITNFSKLFNQEYSVIHLVRNPKAVALSRTKNRKKRLAKNTHPRPRLASKFNLMMGYDSIEWCRDNRWMEKFKKDKTHVDFIYENLDETLDDALKDFFNICEIKIGQKMIENHIIWGSTGTRMNYNSKIIINQKWKNELNSGQKFMIDLLTYPIRKFYSYNFSK